ncbi:MAG: alpha/beta hydrolase [Gammaproteobacteria bacterium]|nr:alpha/beta hydrolase [Gammaproteobacteria bacterium]MDH3409158.1 alpha/beta hydrolase [Gammaproteobacteria bacterium]
MPNERLYVAKQRRRVVQLAIRGVDYAVSEWGSKQDPLLVYLHGWGDTGSTFQFVVDKLRRNWFVIAPDWRGFGKSSGGAAAYWFPDYLADLDYLLNLYSPQEPVRLIGHSMGGNIAGLYAGVIPERVAGIVNLEGFGLPDTSAAEAPARYRSWIERGRERPEFSVRESFDALAKKIRRNAPGMSPAQAEFVAREWAEEQADGRIRLRADPAHKLLNPVLYRRAEAEACWGNVTAAVLLIAGRRSRFAAATTMPFPRQTTAHIDQAGHMLHFEQPAAVARLIEEFFAKPST